MIELIGGPLWQWDTGRIAAVRPETDQDIHEVHFTTRDMNSAPVVKTTYTADGTVYCTIPSKLLQQGLTIYAYEVTATDSGEKTVSKTELPVNKRNKPEDYIYTEGEVLSYRALAERIRTLESMVQKLEDQLGVTGN